MERPAGSSSPLAPSMTSATSLVKTPDRFYGRHREGGNHLGATQASSSSVPSRLEQGVSPAGEDSVDDQNQTPPSNHGTEHQSPAHLGTPEIQSPSNHGTRKNQSPMQPGTSKSHARRFGQRIASVSSGTKSMSLCTIFKCAEVARIIWVMAIGC